MESFLCSFVLFFWLCSPGKSQNALPVVTLTSNRANVDKVYTATLNCTATGGIPQMYTYTWMHDGKVLQSETSSILTGVDETKLGNYTCVVENLAGTAINSIVIHQRLPGIQSLPAVLFSSGSKQIVQNSVLWLYCTINSVSRTLRMEWRKNGSRIVQNTFHIRARNVISTTHGRTSLILIIDYFQGSDVGIYQCFATNKGEMVRGSALMLRAPASTTGELQFISANATVSRPSHYHYYGKYIHAPARSGHGVTFFQKLGRAHVMSFSRPQVSCLHNGRPFRVTPTDSFSRVSEMDTSNVTYEYTIQVSFNFSLSDDGVYQCVSDDHIRNEVYIAPPVRFVSGEGVGKMQYGEGVDAIKPGLECNRLKPERKKTTKFLMFPAMGNS